MELSRQRLELASHRSIELRRRSNVTNAVLLFQTDKADMRAYKITPFPKFESGHLSSQQKHYPNSRLSLSQTQNKEQTSKGPKHPAQ
jgi:hypothetical protein